MKGTADIKRNHGIIYDIDRKDKNTTQRRNTKTKKTVRMKKTNKDNDKG
ncbi:hypothetical protein [Prevotella sp. PTAC]|nr:hypothetical protein [Prevotella sp. PTAC]NPD55249.1 hypothetical protein [Prevotella sp. PTAC]